jgi:hypothetical protein
MLINALNYLNNLYWEIKVCHIKKGSKHHVQCLFLLGATELRINLKP